MIPLMSRSFTLFFVIALGAASAAPTVQFNRDIRPVLADACFPVSYTHLTLPTSDLV